MDTSSMDDGGYNAGDIVSSFGPFVKSLMLEYRTVCCANCFMEKPGSLKVCPRCLRVVYCNERCQRKDWNNGHKIECTLWQSKEFQDYCFKGKLANIITFRLRLYALMKMRPELATKKFQLSNFEDGATRCLNDLKPRPGNVGFMVEWIDAMLDCGEMARQLDKVSPGSGNRDDLVQQAGVIQWHIRFIAGKHFRKGIGFGIFMESTIIPHSCHPTAVLVGIGPKLFVRAITRIGPLELPTITYICANRNREYRQALLQEKYGLLCDCYRCEYNADSHINFRWLNYNINKLKVLSRKTCVNDTWAKIFDDHEFVTHALESILRKYDKSNTNQFETTFILATKTNPNKKEVLEFAKEVCERLSITYGYGHQNFKDFKKILIERYGLDVVNRDKLPWLPRQF